MPVSLSGRSILSDLDLSPQELRHLLALARRFKELKRTRTPHRSLEGRNIVLLFEKTSTRTRCSFEVAGTDLGMGVTYLDPGSSQMGTKESIEDTARVLGRMFDGIEYRGFDQSIVEELAGCAGVPVWNGLTTQFHPTQSLADLLTISECFPRGLDGQRVVFLGDAQNNVANSLMLACATMGLHYVACSPTSLAPAADLVEAARERAAASGGSVTLTDDVVAATTGADVLYTDVWVSMGEDESLWGERIALLEPYRVDAAAMARASEDAVFLHCLPAFHDTRTATGARIAERFGVTEMEVSDEVFRSARSRVFDQAENRLHTIKAMVYATLA